MPAYMVLPDKVKTLPAIPTPFQRYVYPFSTPHFKTANTFSRLEQVITVPGCRVSNTIYFTEKSTVIRSTQRKNDLLTLQVTLSEGCYQLLKLHAGRHQLRLEPGIHEYMRFDISPSLLKEWLPDYRKSLNGELRIIKTKLHSLIRQLRNTHVTDDIQQLKVYTLIMELITTAIATQPMPTKTSDMNNPHHELVTRIQDYINDNLHKSISLSMLAGIYYISESKLKQDFKKYLNSSVQMYLQEQRMLKALKMLQHSDDEIAQIASEVGYSNVSSFIREFRKHYACSPKEIRIR